MEPDPLVYSSAGPLNIWLSLAEAQTEELSAGMAWAMGGGLWLGKLAGAEVSASTTSSEAESGARSVSSIVRQWDRKINHFLGSHPAPTVPGARPAR